MPRLMNVAFSVPRRQIACAALVALALGLAAPRPAEADHRPLRSGRIVSGVLTTSPSWNCELVPDCAAWLAAGCEPALAGRDPAWLASIVPIGTIADGTTTRTFAYGPDDSVSGVPLGIVPGGVTIEFWHRDCRRIGGETRIWTSRGGWTWGQGNLVVPHRAAWMTVTANDKVNMGWRLT